MLGLLAAKILCLAAAEVPAVSVTHRCLRFLVFYHFQLAAPARSMRGLNNLGRVRIMYEYLLHATIRVCFFTV